MSTVFSHSRLSSFENCPKQFHFRYIEKIPAETESVEAFVGKRVHEILERLYVFVGQGMVPAVEKVVHRYHALWDETFDPERVRIVREGTPLSFYRGLGERCLRNFYQRHYPFDADETLALEEKVQFQLDAAGRYRIRGVIDRLVRAADGVIEIQDYKTGQRVPSQKQLDKDRQLALYQLGVGERFPGEPIRLKWHFVSSGQVRTSTRNAEELEALRLETISLIDRIGAEKEFAPTPIPLCSWCEYKPICPAWTTRPPSPPPPDADEIPSWTQLDLL
ncbi:MAG: PD-(D/E)XK nuclease family protein [Proteobacteria bacterium]|nr:PD-(D/E)XK nuclease family protein [Pseudomonadota bacterium]